MRLLLVRHGDPDYVHDCLTEKGKREAQDLADYADKWNMGTCFMSPCGRAQETASYVLKKLGKTAETLPWLMEFVTCLNINGHEELLEAFPDVRLNDGSMIAGPYTLPGLLKPEKLKEFGPDENGNVPKYGPHIVWDIMPSYLAKHRELLDPEDWRTSEIAKLGDIPYYYDYVTGKFDELLAKHGYRRDDFLYHVESANEETLVFFCHLGLMCVLMSHLLHVSPFAMLQGCAFAPTSVSELVTEEREKGIASFRALKLGDVSHLRAAGEPVSFSARFCETYDNKEQRH
ncbi:MAG: histidine phosphatase family protein [Lachnospiraceae bacterium]|nr:histidine phosphatase family protein [Lachnospiraceae bacterium]MCH4063900.1 histidine phosphatase family protein [Lachnospiraceae bacterium]MCH4103378.1 histidine phosphatase family protein [Lachnospiraceae bacterium]MCI1309327.1 histidine phosphatase family protein [Lachnospiraceae bacterium]MCI1333690.1 histidine phosphatase family protein [Lachnospiraceae bacterium]